MRVASECSPCYRMPSSSSNEVAGGKILLATSYEDIELNTISVYDVNACRCHGGQYVLVPTTPTTPFTSRVFNRPLLCSTNVAINALVIFLFRSVGPRCSMLVI